MYLKELIQFGLTKTQAQVLNFLLENGENKVRDITKAVRHPRGVIYNTLEELIELELVEKIEKNKEIAKFQATHPRNIEKLLEEKEKTFKQNKKIFSEVLPMLSSSYNLTISKPGVKFYEGEEGLRKVMDDTLTSKTEIYTFLNKEAIIQEEKFREINEEYKKRRERKGVIKKIIRIGAKTGTDLAQTNTDGGYDEITKIKYIDKEVFPFKASVQIYDNKISYQIFDKGNVIAILVEEKNIYEMHKAFFEVLWEKIAD